jgi:GMP synthase-like glutamine amidotransferase
VFQWHEDTFAVPDGAALLATAGLCRNQAFRKGNAAYGLQFHMEITPQMIESWAEKDPTVDAGRIAKEGAPHWSHFEERSMTVLGNFQRLMESSRRVKRTVKLFVETKQSESARLWWSQADRTLLGR